MARFNFTRFVDILKHRTHHFYAQYQPFPGDEIFCETEDSAQQKSTCVEKEVKLEQLAQRSSRDHLTVLLFYSLALLLFSIWFFISRHFQPSERTCTYKFSAWSPLNNLVHYRVSRFDEENLDDAYFGNPIIQRERNWENLWTPGTIGLDYDMMDLMNRSSVDGDWLRGPSPFENLAVGWPDLLHQVHCLNLVRMYAHNDIWPLSKFPKTTELIFEHHKNHCLIILMKKIMCESDVSLALIEETGERDRKWKPFDLEHKCKNYLGLVDWIHDHEVCDLICPEAHP